MSQTNISLCKAVVEKLDPQLIASAVSAIVPDSTYGLSELIRGISTADCASWMNEFVRRLDRDACLRFAANWPQHRSAYAFSKFCDTLVWKDTNLALDMVEAFLPTLSARLLSDPITVFRELDSTIWHVLRLVDPLQLYTGKRRATSRMRAIGKKLSLQLKPGILAEKLSASTKRDFQTSAVVLSFLRKVAPGKYTATVRSLNWDLLDSTIGDDWSGLFHEAEVFMAFCCADAEARRAVVGVIERNLFRISVLPPRLAIIAPNAGYKHVSMGRVIALSQHDHFDWRFSAGVLKDFAEECPSLVEKLLEPHLSTASALMGRDPSFYRDAIEMIRLMRQVAPDAFSKLLTAIDPLTAENGWAAALKQGGDTRRVVALLIESAIGRRGDLGKLARNLRKSFPRLSLPLASDMQAEPLTPSHKQ
jgi:hypothetical protein